MSKRVLRDNYRVVIEPNMQYAGWSIPHGAKRDEYVAKEGKSRAESMMSDARRHIDGIGSIYLESDDVSCCEHCGYNWTEESTTYNGGCCEKDEENNPENARAA